MLYPQYRRQLHGFSLTGIILAALYCGVRTVVSVHTLIKADDVKLLLLQSWSDFSFTLTGLILLAFALFFFCQPLPLLKLASPLLLGLFWLLNTVQVSWNFLYFEPVMLIPFALYSLLAIVFFALFFRLFLLETQADADTKPSL